MKSPVDLSRAACKGCYAGRGRPPQPSRLCPGCDGLHQTFKQTEAQRSCWLEVPRQGMHMVPQVSIDINESRNVGTIPPRTRLLAMDD